MSDGDDVLKTSKHHPDFRTRIASALMGDHCVQGMTAPCDDCRAHALRQADKVIRELGLTRRTGQGPFSNQVWYQTDWTIE